MSDQTFDLQPAEDPAPKASGFDLQPEETAPAEGENIGVYPLASRAQHRAALAAMQADPVSLTAFKAARGPAPEQAAKALQLAKDRSFSPQFTADNLDTIQQAHEQSGFEDALGVSPVLAAYAGQSAVHASAVKDDVSVLQALEMGLADVGYAATARKYMDDPSKVDAGGLATYEEASGDLSQRIEDVQDPIDRIALQTARAIPSVAAYGASTVLGTLFGGGGGGTLGMGTALYQLNRGVLYRRILAASPVPTADERAGLASLEGKDASDEQYAAWAKERQDFETLAKKYAKEGALTGATIGAVLGDAFTRSLPIANAALRKIGDEIASKATAETVAKAATERATEFAGHTLSGAMLMAEQAVVDDAAVQKATTGTIDYGKAVEAGKDAFTGGLAVAAVLSSVTPGREFLADLGRIRNAKVEASRLDDLAARAKESKVVARSPAEAEALLGKMAGAGDTPTVYIDQAGLQDPKVAQAIVEALADGGTALAQAQATQGDVALPMGTYLTKVAPELHEQLREHTKLSSDGYTVTQATEAEKALPQEPDKAVFDEYRQKALAAGRGAQEAVAIGKIVSAAFQRFADGEGLGRSAADVSKQFPIDIGATAAPGMRLDQNELKNLLVQHNLTAENLLHADELGGLAVPSLAIARKEFPSTQFGEISLLAPSNMVDPATGVPVFNRDVWSPRWPDMRFKINAKGLRALREAISPFGEKTGLYLGDVESELKKNGVEGVLERREWRGALGLKYLEEKGRGLPDVMENVPLERGDVLKQPAMRQFVAEHGIKRDFQQGDAYHRALTDAYRKAVEALATSVGDPELGNDLRQAHLTQGSFFGRPEDRWSVFDEEGKTKGLLDQRTADKVVEGLQKFGTKRIDTSEMRDAAIKAVDAPDVKPDFEAWAREKLQPAFGERYIPKYRDSANGPVETARPYTLENIVREMTRGRIQQGEGGGGMLSGFGHLLSAAARKFRTLEAIKKERGALAAPEETAERRKTLSDRVADLATELGRYHTTAGEDRESFRRFDAFLSAVSESFKRGHNLRVELAKDGFTDVPADLLGKVRNLMEDMRKLPDDVFEAKPQRAVGLNEFKHAVVPEDASPEVLDVLRKHGIDVTTYPKGDEQARRQAIAGAAAKGQLLFQAAYHGSPHVFEKFSMQHIGKGEGAQVYGHGLYFAENKETANYYRKVLADVEVRLDGAVVPRSSFFGDSAADHLNQAQDKAESIAVARVRSMYEALLGTKGKAEKVDVIDTVLARVMDGLAIERRLLDEGRGSEQVLHSLEGQLRVLGDLSRNPDRLDLRQTGALYKVDVPEKSELLDYDKKISEQSPAVRAALGRLGVTGTVPEEAPTSWTRVGTGNGATPQGTGQSAYLELSSRLGSSQAASEALREAGIPGLRYLDQGSRFGNNASYDPHLGKAAEGFKDAGLSWNDALEKMIEQFPKAPTSEIDSALADAYKFRTHNFVIWDDSKIRTLDVLKQQPVEGTPLTAGVTSERGHIVIGFPGENGGRQSTIDLSNPDKSTLAHEIFHGLSVIMGDIAQKETAHPEFRKDYDSLTRFMGYESIADRASALDPAKEEKAALAWEQYLFEGKAPSPELRGTFSRFKTWLTRIYGSLKGNLPDDVRKVFDRMLAREKTQGEIDYAGHATAIIDAKPIAEIQPGRYELAARRAGAKAMDLAREGSREAKLITPQRPQGESVRYEVVEAKSLVPSHMPDTFSPNEAYPENVQERSYQLSDFEQGKVSRGGAALNPSLLLTNTPSPLDGPPIVTAGEKRVVLGGNGRTMMILRAFKDEAQRNQYREQLTARAREFGISPDEVKKLKEPVLVRVASGVQDTAPTQELAGAVRRFNEGMTQALTPKARALAQARTLTPATVDALGTLMFEHGDSSLRDVLRDRAKDVLEILRRDGVVNDTNAGRWVQDGTLTTEAKSEIEGMFVGRVIENETRLNSTAPELLTKVEKAAPYLLRVQGINSALDETGTVRKAVDLLNNAQAQGLKLKDALGQGDLLKARDPAVVAMAEMLASSTQRDAAARFKKWAAFAGVDPRQTGLFGSAPTLESSLGTLLGEPKRFKGYDRAQPQPEAAPEAQPKAEATPAQEQPKVGEEQPKEQGDLQKYRTASDLSHAMADVATKVKAEMERAREYIRGRDTEKARGQIGKAGQEYLGAFDAILDAIDENTPRGQAQPEALDALLQRMQADGEPIGFDAQDLRALLEKPIGWKALTPPEARNVVNAVKNLNAAARRVNEITLAGEKAQLRDLVRGMKQYLDERHTPDSGLPAPSGASKGPLDRAAARIGNAATESLQPRVILERLGPGGRAIYDDFVRARNLKEQLANDVAVKVQKFYDALPKELKKSRFDGVKGPGSPVFADNLWTRQDLWEFTSWWGSESGSDRIKRGLRITDGQAHEFMSQLTKAEADFLESKWKLNDETLWPLVRDHAREVTGTEPEKIEARPFTIRTTDGGLRELRGGYEPARYRADIQSTAKSPDDVQSVADYWGALRDNFEPSTANYFTKERLQNVSRVPDLNWNSYSGHVNSVLQYLAYDDFVRNAGRVLRDPEFRSTVQQRLGQQDIRELDKFLSVAARGRVESATDGANELSRLVGDGLRSRLATAAFQGNLRVFAGQLSHVPAAAFRLGLAPQDLVYGLSQSLRPSTWGESFDASKQLPYRWNGYARKMQSQFANIGPGDGPTSHPRVDAALWSLYHVMDGFLSKTIYEAAASKAERAGATPDEARLAGDRGVERMMPPLNLAEQSSLARDRGAIGALILVRNFPNQLLNADAELLWEARNSVWAADPGWQKAKAVLGPVAVRSVQALGMVWSAHLIGRFLMGHGRRDDETTAEWALRSALAAPFYPIPFGSEVAEPVAESIVTDKTLKQAVFEQHGFAAAPAIAELERAIRDLSKVVDSGTADEERFFAGLRLAANALRLPSDPLRGIQYGYDLTQGNVQPRGLFDVGGGLLYGQRARQSKNPLTTAQDLLSGD